MNIKKYTGLYLGLCFLLLGGNGLFAQQKLGDNLGNHRAVKTVDMNGQNIVDVSGMVIGKATLENSSVALQIDGANKALVIPKVNDLNDVANPVDGMLVYSTAATDKRFYMRQRGAWVNFAPFNLQPGQVLVGDVNNRAAAVTITGDVLLNENGATSLKDKAITTAMLTAESVTSVKITDGSVHTIHLAENAVNTAKLADVAVTGPKLALTAVSTAKLADNAVTAAKISSATAGNDKVLTIDNNGAYKWESKSTILVPALTLPTLTNAQIIMGSNAGIPLSTTVTGDLAISADGAAEIQEGAITSPKIADLTIQGADIATNAITPAKISSTTNGTNKILKTNSTGDAVWADRFAGFSVGDLKAFFPNLMGTMPDGWVECNGQTLSDPLSALDGKVLPALNDNTYLIGSTGPSGLTVGSNTLMITRNNLPNITLSGTLSGASSGIASGSIAITADGYHTHSITSNHGHLFRYSGGGWLSNISMDDGRFRGGNSNTGQSSGNFSTLTTTTGVTIDNNDFIHTHAATFTGTALPLHAHTLNINSINDVAQTAVNMQPPSVTVKWIMKVR